MNREASQAPPLGMTAVRGRALLGSNPGVIQGVNPLVLRLPPGGFSIRELSATDPGSDPGTHPPVPLPIRE